MTREQYNRANCLRGRIRELKIMQEGIERKGSETKIGDYNIPKNSKEVILAMCKKEIDELEQEFDNL